MEIFEKMNDPNWIQCPHCNGYGSSLKEECETCSKCGGDGLIYKPNLISVKKMELSTEEWVQTKEDIASILFDYENGVNDYVRPHEEECHILAELIMEHLGYKVVKEM